nr:hypothetical protein [uncultured Rhodoferax sp.]
MKNTERRTAIYVAIGAIFGVSTLTYILLPDDQFIQQLAALPVVGSLVAALFQILRDQASHEREVLAQASDHRFALGASSHMSDVAFDKHVLFCEEYVAEVFATLDTLFREGPTDKVLPHAASLFQLRRKHAVWLTSLLDVSLQKFERALREIGANDWYLKNSERPSDRQDRVNSLYKTFADVLGEENMGASEWQGQPLSPEMAISKVLQGLRHVLGTEELTELRAFLVQKALSEKKGR